MFPDPIFMVRPREGEGSEHKRRLVGCIKKYKMAFLSVFTLFVIIFSASADWIIGNQDKYSFLLTRNNNKSDETCLQITDETHIPPDAKGTIGFGQDCDPAINSTAICKRYETIEYIDKGNNNAKASCMMATHFICDPFNKKCVCGHEEEVIDPIRVQVGDLNGKNHDKGVCHIRPSFEHILGFPCAPTSKRRIPTQNCVDDDHDGVCEAVCNCAPGKMDDLVSKEKDWWYCKDGGSLTAGGMSMLIIIFCLVLNHIITAE